VATSESLSTTTEQIVDSLLDWQDLDMISRSNGNETPNSYGIRNGAIPSLSEVTQIDTIPDKVQQLLMNNSTLYKVGDFSPYYATEDLLIALTNTKVAAEVMRLRQTGEMTVVGFSQLTGIDESDNSAFYISNYLQVVLMAEVGQSVAHKQMTLEFNRYAQGISKPFNIFISRG
jgi:hypothetical protein